jgi:ABC-type Fe3+ transport system substrate-binding protein
MIARPFIFIIMRGVAPTPAARAFLDWALTTEGQAIVSRNWVSVNGLSVFL